MKKNSTNKKTIIAIIAVCVLAVCVLLFFFLSKKTSTFIMKNDVSSGPSQENNIEEDGIKAANLQAVQEAESQIAAQPVKSISSEDHFLGNLDAPIQLIAYSDFACPFCLEFNDTIGRITEEFGDKVAVAFRHFPLAAHAYAMPAAIASECAAEQGKFWEMHDKLFENNQEKIFHSEQFKKDAADIGLNAAKFNQCLETEKYKNKIQDQILEARNFGVSGAPASFVNGEPLPGAYQFEDFTRPNGDKEEGMKSIIERHLKD
ncbi:DsbA family protein [Patescibacteria group bacterium]|nr:DsbA family protein [Patescibacteria group bacterium]MBU4600582.1 DsbA family protein [Patescibacteria group bacterium]MCG2697987.1 DsbA family protein [Candidatus Parcubacteria bacterium]